jgi:hypothetical protein
VSTKEKLPKNIEDLERSIYKTNPELHSCIGEFTGSARVVCAVCGKPITVGEENEQL